MNCVQKNYRNKEDKNVGSNYIYKYERWRWENYSCRKCCIYAIEDRKEKKVLLIDMDPQMNATQYTLTESQMNEILEDRNKSVYGCLSPDYQANSVLDGYEQRKEEKWFLM